MPVSSPNIPKSPQEILNAVLVAAGNALSSALSPYDSQDVLNAVLHTTEDALRITMDIFQTPDAITTTDATVTVIDTITTEDDQVTVIESDIIGIKSDGSQIFQGKLRHSWKNDGGVLSQVGIGNSLDLENPGSWGGISLTASGTSIQINVSGKAATSIKWRAINYINQQAYS